MVGGFVFVVLIVVVTVVVFVAGTTVKVRVCVSWLPVLLLLLRGEVVEDGGVECLRGPGFCAGCCCFCLLSGVADAVVVAWCLRW